MVYAILDLHTGSTLKQSHKANISLIFYHQISESQQPAMSQYITLCNGNGESTRNIKSGFTSVGQFWPESIILMNFNLTAETNYLQGPFKVVGTFLITIMLLAYHVVPNESKR